MSYTGTVPHYRVVLSTHELDLLARTLAVVLHDAAVRLDARERGELEILWRDFAKAPEADEIVPVCPMHDELMVQLTGKRRGWWRCRLKNDDGSVCTYQRDIRP